MINKIHRFVSYPEILSLDPYVNKDIQHSDKENHSTSNFTYELYAVVTHRGQTPFSGHIFSYIRSPAGLWYRADDETVTQVQSNVALNEKDAYILCYAKTLTEPSPLLSSLSINSPIKSSSSIFTSTPINPRLNERQKLDDNFNLVRI